MLIVLSISSPANSNTIETVNTYQTVSREEIKRCQMDDKAVEQLHEIRTEQRHTRFMLQNIEGANNQLVNNARRQLQQRLSRIERAEQFVLSTSCN